MPRDLPERKFAWFQQDFDTTELSIRLGIIKSMEYEDIFIQAETRYKDLSELQKWIVKRYNNQPLLWPGLTKAILNALSGNSYVITLTIAHGLHISLQVTDKHVKWSNQLMVKQLIKLCQSGRFTGDRMQHVGNP